MVRRRATATTAAAPPSSDAEALRRYMREMIAAGAVDPLIAQITDLVERLLQRNNDLTARLAEKDLGDKARAKPPTETLRRLRDELPAAFARNDPNGPPAANEDGREIKPPRPRTKRGPKRARPHGRNVMPDHLARVIDVHRIPEEDRRCERCASAVCTVGFKVARRLELIPARLVVLEIRREVVACASAACHRHVRTAPAPDQIVDRGVLGTELIVQAAVDHWADGVPWERVARNARAQGVPLSASTLASSAGRAIDLLDPIVRHITDKALGASLVAFDASALPILDREAPLGMRTGAMWNVLGDERWSLFIAAPSGHAAHLKKRLEGYRFALGLCDGANTNNVIDDLCGARAGCNAHGRRGLAKAARVGDERAIEGILIYAEIFAVEKESARLREGPDARRARRQRDSAPLVSKLRAWLDARLADVEPRSLLGKALRYLDNQWSRLTLFLTEGALPLTNNHVERLLRTFVLDRKVWLFVGHDESARRTADALTVITTCRNLGVDPRRYVRDTVRRLLAGERDLAALLPENYVPLPA